MIRNTVIFLLTFALGALVALAARTALHQPHAGAAHAAPAPETGAPMVNNALRPAGGETPSTPGTHAGHAGAEVSTPAPVPAASGHEHEPKTGKAATTPVNTRCAICGMPVDPSLPTLEYQGKTIGFGCRMCPPKFKADPDKYGPLYLKNEVIKR